MSEFGRQADISHGAINGPLCAHPSRSTAEIARFEADVQMTLGLGPSRQSGLDRLAARAAASDV